MFLKSRRSKVAVTLSLLLTLSAVALAYAPKAAQDFSLRCREFNFFVTHSLACLEALYELRPLLRSNPRGNIQDGLPYNLLSLQAHHFHESRIRVDTAPVLDARYSRRQRICVEDF